jgi:hypothetical protein
MKNLARDRNFRPEAQEAFFDWPSFALSMTDNIWEMHRDELEAEGVSKEEIDEAYEAFMDEDPIERAKDFVESAFEGLRGVPNEIYYEHFDMKAWKKYLKSQGL